MSYANWPQYNVSRPSYVNRVRPVSSAEEVKSSPIEYDGSIFYFHDLVNKKVYTKKLNLEGVVQIEVYDFAQDISPTFEGKEEYLTKAEFNEAINKLLTEVKGEKSHESNGNNANDNDKSNVPAGSKNGNRKK